MNVRYLDSRVSDRQHVPLLRLPTIGAEAEPVQAEQPALLMTNEIVSPGQLVEWGNQHKPDGYIVAVGCGMSLLLPSLFSADRPPRGVLLVDLDDRVVAMAHAFVAALQQTQSYEEFHERFLSHPLQSAVSFLTSEQAAPLSNLEASEIRQLNSGIDSLRNTGGQDVDALGRPNLIGAFSSVYHQWKQLADSGKICIHQGSICSAPLKYQDNFEASVKRLWPDFAEHGNVVYLSNVVDHVVDADVVQPVSSVIDGQPELGGHSDFEQIFRALLQFEIAANGLASSKQNSVLIWTTRMHSYRLQYSVNILEDNEVFDFCHFDHILHPTIILRHIQAFSFGHLESHQRDSSRSQDSIAGVVTSFDLMIEKYATALGVTTQLATEWVKAVKLYILAVVSQSSRRLTRVDGYNWVSKRFGSDFKRLVMLCEL